MSKYDEKAKERTMRCLKKNYEQLCFTLPKGTKAKYKAYAATRGMSVTEMFARFMESEMERSGFEYKESADE